MNTDTYIHEDDLQLGKLKENCLLLKLRFPSGALSL